MSFSGTTDTSQQAKSCGFCGESPGMVVFGGGNPRGNLGCKWNENTRKFRGNSYIGVEMRGKFPQTCKNFNSPKNDIEWSLGYFQTTGTLPMSLNRILQFGGKHERNFHVNIPRDSTGKGGRNFHIENSPSFLLNFHREIMRKFPQGWSPGIPLWIRVEILGRGWLARWDILKDRNPYKEDVKKKVVPILILNEKTVGNVKPAWRTFNLCKICNWPIAHIFRDSIVMCSGIITTDSLCIIQPVTILFTHPKICALCIFLSLCVISNFLLQFSKVYSIQQWGAAVF